MLGSHRRHSRRLSAWLILALLFMQLATASYACPQYTGEHDAGEAMAMPGCEGASGAADMDPDQPLLCQASCDDAAQASTTWSGGDLTLPAVLLYVLPRAASSDPQFLRSPRALPAAGESPPGWPPVYLFNCILRS